MWSFKWQTVFRKLILCLIVIAGLGLAIYWSTKGPFSLSSGELKLRYTWYLLRIENLQAYYHFWIFMGITALSLIGFPSIFGIIVAVLLWGSYKGFVAVMAAQMVASGVLMLKIQPTTSGLKKLEPELMEMIKKSETSPKLLAIYLRLFISFPLRTIDQMVSFACGNKNGIFLAYIFSGIGIGIRLLVETAWFISLLNLILDYRPYPEVDLTWFLISSALIIFSYIWPTMPEIAPGDKETGKLLLVLAGEQPLSHSSNQEKVS